MIGLLLLQYYIATLVDNKIPGVAAVAQQRSGRPLKSIERTTKMEKLVVSEAI